MKDIKQIICRSCGGVGTFKEIDNKEKFLFQIGNIPVFTKKLICTACGFITDYESEKSIQHMTCKACGNIIEITPKEEIPFCPYCGSKIKKKKK